VITNKGVIYVAANNPWVKEAVYSARHVKRYCKELPITLFSNKPVELKYIDNFIKISNNLNERQFKFNYLWKSPYEYSLYLDSDTQIMCDISEDFKILSKSDIALCHCVNRVSKEVNELVKEYPEIPYSFCEFNSGVMFFKKTERFEKFTKLWQELYYRYKKEFKITNDQYSLRVALWNSDLKIYTLPIEYNLQHVRKREKTHKNIKARVIHGRKLYNKGKKWKRKYFEMISS